MHIARRGELFAVEFHCGGDGVGRSAKITWNVGFGWNSALFKSSDGDRFTRLLVVKKLLLTHRPLRIPPSDRSADDESKAKDNANILV